MNLRNYVLFDNNVFRIKIKSRILYFCNYHFIVKRTKFTLFCYKTVGFTKYALKREYCLVKPEEIFILFRDRFEGLNLVEDTQVSASKRDY